MSTEVGGGGNGATEDWKASSVTGSWRAEGSQGTAMCGAQCMLTSWAIGSVCFTAMCGAQCMLTSWAIGSVCFSLCAAETTEEFKGGKRHDLVCLLKRTPSCHAENGLEMTGVKERKPLTDLFQNSKQGRCQLYQNYSSRGGEKWVDQEIFGSNFGFSWWWIILSGRARTEGKWNVNHGLPGFWFEHKINRSVVFFFFSQQCRNQRSAALVFLFIFFLCLLACFGKRGARSWL